MTAHPTPAGECLVPGGEHASRVRLYAFGRLCDAHSPWALAGRPAPLGVEVSASGDTLTATSGEPSPPK